MQTQAGEEGILPAGVGMPWIESPYAEEMLASLPPDGPLTHLARALHRDGLALFDFPLDNMVNVARDIRRTLAGGYGSDKRIMHAWRRNPHVRALACAPRVLELLAFLYGRAPVPFQTLNFETGTQQRMHSDAMHFHCWPARYMCGVWVALEDVDEANGPLMYYPGSHRLPLLDLDDLGLRHLPTSAARYAVYENVIERFAAERGLTRRTLHMRQGQAVIWAANLLHGGAPIAEAARTRLSQVTHYFFADCVYHSPIQADTSPLNPFLLDVQDIRDAAYVQRARDFPRQWRRSKLSHLAHVVKHEGARGAWRRARRKVGL